jgi:hypothetical protein
LEAQPTLGAPTVTTKIRAVFFWGGIILYLCSFSLPAIVEVDTNIIWPGYDCALMSILVVGMIPDLFRFGYSLLHCVLESAAIVLVAPINLVLLLYAIASPFRPADRTVHVSRILIPSRFRSRGSSSTTKIIDP